MGKPEPPTPRCPTCRLVAVAIGSPKDEDRLATVVPLVLESYRWRCDRTEAKLHLVEAAINETETKTRLLLEAMREIRKIRRLPKEADSLISQVLQACSRARRPRR